MAPDLHPDLAALAPLVGSWRGRGHGDYSTITAFDYVEEVDVTAPPGKPFLAYRQRTRDADSGEPLHAETGYFRPAGPGRLELVVAQPSGIVEAHEGTVAGGRIDLRSTAVLATPTAKTVTEVHRHLEVVGDALHYRLEMAAVGEDLRLHLEATLRRLD